MPECLGAERRPVRRGRVSTWWGGKVKEVTARLCRGRIVKAFQAVLKHLATGILWVKKGVELSDECFKRASYCFDNGLDAEGRNRKTIAIILRGDALNPWVHPVSCSKKNRVDRGVEGFSGRRKRDWHLFRNSCPSFSASRLDVGMNLHFVKFQMDISTRQGMLDYTHHLAIFLLFKSRSPACGSSGSSASFPSLSIKNFPQEWTIKEMNVLVTNSPLL